MRSESYKCDSCGQTRGEVSSWYVLLLGAWIKAEEATGGRLWEASAASVCHFTSETASQPGAVHLCGEACLLKRVSQWAASEAGSAATPMLMLTR